MASKNKNNANHGDIPDRAWRYDDAEQQRHGERGAFHRASAARFERRRQFPRRELAVALKVASRENPVVQAGSDESARVNGATFTCHVAKMRERLLRERLVSPRLASRRCLQD